MEDRYIRNQIYINEKEQQVIKDYKVLIAGCGIGSYIAECLLRLGFENMTIIDGDLVECSNLNRQNYVERDIGESKADSLQRRLLAINDSARIEVVPKYITAGSLKKMKIDHMVAINALDFTTDVPFLFDHACSRVGVPVIHPYNLGWAGFVTVITSESKQLLSLENRYKVFELNVGEFIVDSLKKENVPVQWFEKFLAEYNNIAHISSPPQLSVGVQLLSGMVANIIFNIATNKPYKQFPDYYYLSINEA